MPEIILTVQHEAGLHARPLARFVRMVKQFDVQVQVYNLSAQRGPANGASPLAMLLLGVQQGHQVRIVASGPQAEPALEALRELIESNFVDESVEPGSG
ncbi:MAG: HPr family phosphocarrier protein, partial [Chloroflexi bacterium]|nr:HPr family phosphocarrier protein [Anaerolineaceae bacterium]NMB90365.1 HPr family phosphocarrier protein [Chloroflexota bacterium]